MKPVSTHSSTHVSSCFSVQLCNSCSMNQISVEIFYPEMAVFNLFWLKWLISCPASEVCLFFGSWLNFSASESSYCIIFLQSEVCSFMYFCLIYCYNAFIKVIFTSSGHIHYVSELGCNFMCEIYESAGICIFSVQTILKLKLSGWSIFAFFTHDHLRIDAISFIWVQLLIIASWEVTWQ